MLIDKTHIRWIVWTLALFLLSAVLYVIYAVTEPDGPTGGSWQGMLFGIAGSSLMIYAGLLSVRKRFPHWRIGSAQTWLRGHIWLGSLSVPLILFHAGFGWGGLLETVLLLILAAIVLSGFVGLLLQIYLPRVLKVAIPAETIYEEIPTVCTRLRHTADTEVKAVCGSLMESSPGVISTDADGGSEAAVSLKKFYLSAVRPYLAPDIELNGRTDPQASKMASEVQASAMFEQLRVALPDELHRTVENLVAVCDERRQLARQTKLHHWLHGWLFVHIPLSLALLVLGILHAITAVYY